MFRGYWRLKLAALVVAGSCFSGQAQELQGKPERPADEQQESTRDLPLPLPIVVIESEESTLARERAEQTAAEREKNDLISQQGMDATAQRMAKYALWQTWLIAIGTAALILTLYETRRVTTVTRDMAVAQIRPWISVKDVCVTEIGVSPIQMNDDTDDRPQGFSLRVGFTVRNTGKMPAEAILTYFGLHDPSETESSFAEWQEELANSFVSGATRNDVGNSFPPEAEEVLRPRFALRRFTDEEIEEGSFIPFFSIFVRYFIPGEKIARVFVQGYMVVAEQGSDSPTGSILRIDSVERDREMNLMADPIGISRAG